MSTRQPRSDGIEAAQSRAQGVHEHIDVPEGLSLPTEEHRRLWRQFSSMKLERDWKTGDLVQLHEAVGMMVQIRAVDSRLQEMGLLLAGPNGLIRANPLTKILVDLRTQKRHILHALGLFATNQTEASVRRRAPSVADERAAARIESEPPKKVRPALLAVGGKN